MQQAATLLKQVRRIELRARKLVNTALAGQYYSAFKGRGMAFDHVREYQPGDDPKTIDWNIAARTNQLFTKQFVQERELNLMLLVDVSASMSFGSRRLKKDVVAELAALLALSATGNQDKVGLILFSDQLELFLPPRKGAQSSLRIIRELLTFESKSVGSDPVKALQFLTRVAPRHSVCFWISDFLMPLNYEKFLRVCQIRQDLTAIQVRDVLEHVFDSSGSFVWQDMESGQMRFVQLKSSDQKQQLKNKLQQQQLQWKQWMHKNKVDVISIATNTSYVPQMVSFFKKRAAHRV